MLLNLVFGSDCNNIISSAHFPLIPFREFSCRLFSKGHILILKCIVSVYVVAFLTISSFSCEGTDIEEPLPRGGMSYWSVGLPQHDQSVGNMEQHMGELRSCVARAREGAKDQLRSCSN